MEERAAYIWRPLDAAQRQIRLLVLEPSERSNTSIRARLIVKSLNRHARYDAISYAWGKPKDSCVVQLDASHWPVTDDLAFCMMRLRHTHNERLLWVDALCVNQFDPVERGQQVQLMEHTFSHAEVVHIFLGQGSLRLNRAFRIIQQLGRGVVPESVEVDGHRLGERDATSLSQFTNFGWWNRLWIIQEVTLARRRIFRYDDLVMEEQDMWGYLWNAREKFDIYRQTMDPEMQDNEVADELKLSLSKLTAFHQLATLLQSTETRPFSEKCTLLIEILYLGRQAEATDKRDRILGFLGICSALFETDLLRADYTGDVSALYTSFAYNLIVTTGSLVLFNQTSQYHNSLTNLPSWVPDWSSRYNFEAEQHRLATHEKCFHACGAMPGVTPDLHQHELLGLPGIVLTSILDCSSDYFTLKLPSVHLLPQEKTAILTTLRRWEQNFLQSPGIRSPAHEDRNARYASRLTGFLEELLEYLHHGGRHETLSCDDLAAWLADASPTPPRQFGLALAILNNRKLFCAGEQLLGVGPPDMEPGDTITILSGGRVPYILRRCTMLRLLTKTKYRLIGECYFQGVMRGEALGRARAKQQEHIWLV